MKHKYKTIEGAELQSLSSEELDALTATIDSERRRRIQEDRELKVDRSATAAINNNCGHFGKNGAIRPGVYPSFNIGLSKPFALLLELCPDCAKAATATPVNSNCKRDWKN